MGKYTYEQFTLSIMHEKKVINDKLCRLFQVWSLLLVPEILKKIQHHEIGVGYKWIHTNSQFCAVEHNINKVSMISDFSSLIVSCSVLQPAGVIWHLMTLYSNFWTSLLLAIQSLHTSIKLTVIRISIKLLSSVFRINHHNSHGYVVYI